jgi:hypothetical protein
VAHCHVQDLRGGLRLQQILPAAAWYVTIICIRFFRAERGKTEYQQKESTALPQAKTPTA